MVRRTQSACRSSRCSIAASRTNTDGSHIAPARRGTTATPRRGARMREGGVRPPSCRFSTAGEVATSLALQIPWRSSPSSLPRCSSAGELAHPRAWSSNRRHRSSIRLRRAPICGGKTRCGGVKARFSDGGFDLADADLDPCLSC